ncbi:D-sedoheptulose-7-phosphate isomerase [Candidatus Nitrospira salsa]|nr:MAG: phosphoheptose isomerase [Nitrospirales bacterium]
MSDRQFLDAYYKKFEEHLMSVDVHAQLIALKDLILSSQVLGKKMIIAGNGGSAAIASHCAIDFTKAAGMRCVSFNESSLITCFANDYGYEHWLEKALEFYADDGDLVVLISSSGRSMNMVRAADYTTQRGLTLVTFTGFSASNPLRSRGDINLWLKSRSYNHIETFHQLWLLSVCDLIVEMRQPKPLTKKSLSRPTLRTITLPVDSAA